MNRTRVSTGTPWEQSVGYSRALRAGNLVFVSGTTASDERGEIQGVGDPYAQTVYILKKIESALREVGCTTEDVVRSRMFVTDIDQWEEVGRAHGEFFRNVLPVTTMVEVTRLIDPGHLVEIEIDAVAQDATPEHSTQ